MTALPGYLEFKAAKQGSSILFYLGISKPQGESKSDLPTPQAARQAVTPLVYETTVWYTGVRCHVGAILTYFRGHHG
jgi:hypothetical protein